VESYDAYIAVPEEIPIVERITEITGITREIVREKGVPILGVLRAFYDAYLKCDVVIAHNIEFDSNMIAIEIARNAELIAQYGHPITEMRSLFTPEFNTKYEIDLYCTMKATIDLCSIMTEYTAPLEIGPQPLVPKAAPKPRVYKKFPKLSELHQTLFGSIPENLHNSLIDVLVCLRCFLKIRCCISVPDTMFDRMLRNVVKSTTKKDSNSDILMETSI
jgi:DNA polymerase III epsilon subunit-like protein